MQTKTRAKIEPSQEEPQADIHMIKVEAGEGEELKSVDVAAAPNAVENAVAPDVTAGVNKY